jgi:hypothetical protein
MRVDPSGTGCRASSQTTLSCVGQRRRGERQGNVATRSRQVRFGKTNASESPMTCRQLYKQRRNRDGRLAREEAQREPVYWLGGARHKGDVIPKQALVRNVRTWGSDAKRRTQADGLREGASIEAEHRGGVARSSDEAGESRWSQGAASFSRGHGSTVRGRNP